MTVAKTTIVPACTVHVDAAFAGAANGSAASPHKTIAAAVSAATNGAVICVAEGTYPEKLAPAAKYFTLAGGFKSNSDFKVRDSAVHVSKAQGDGSGSFFRVGGDNAPKVGQLTAIDGFEITGYAQAIVRATYFSQSFDVTNNNIHDNACAGTNGIGGGLFLNGVSGKISGNVFSKNSCGRGGALALLDATNNNTVTITENLVKDSAGTEPQSSHGGGFYIFAKKVIIAGNEFVGNTVTGWGAGMFVGADGDTDTVATLSWNVYRDNRAGKVGGGFFCDDGAACNSDHELYDGNCGGNVYFDSGYSGIGPTVAVFDHMTNINAKAVGCGAPGAGLHVDKDNPAADSLTVKNSIFWGNASGKDFTTGCISGCGNTKVNVAYSNVQTTFQNGGVAVTFGTGNASADPQFVDPANGDFHLRSKNGHWTPMGYVPDAEDSPALNAGDPAAPVPDNPQRAGSRTELGRYGNSMEASYVQ